MLGLGHIAKHLYRNWSTYAALGKGAMALYNRYRRTSAGGRTSFRRGTAIGLRSRGLGLGRRFSNTAFNAANSFRFRSRRRSRTSRRKFKRRVRRQRRFKRRVARAIPARLKDPPKWHIYRSTMLLDNSGVPPGQPEGELLGNGQAQVDIAHGTSSQYDGLVALMCMAKQNVQLNTGLYRPFKPNGFLRVYKSYMMLFITNNSATPVYGKVGIARPRKHINALDMTPSNLANNDILNKSQVANEWQLGTAQYASIAGLGDNTVAASLGDLGLTWFNSPSFRRWYKLKIRECNWAPMECKRFIFKMRKGFSIDMATEYTLQPASGLSLGDPDAQWLESPQYFVDPEDSGFQIMHQRRGFFFTMNVHGVPGRTTGGTPVVALVQPKMDVYWLNAFKYGWGANTFREYHANPNPLGTAQPTMAIPGFGSAPGVPQLGGS